MGPHEDGQNEGQSMRDETRDKPEGPLEIPGDELAAFAIGVLYAKGEDGKVDFTDPVIKLNIHLFTLQSHSYELTLRELVGLHEACATILKKIHETAEQEKT